MAAEIIVIKEITMILSVNKAGTTIESKIYIKFENLFKCIIKY